MEQGGRGPVPALQRRDRGGGPSARRCRLNASSGRPAHSFLPSTGGADGPLPGALWTARPTGKGSPVPRQQILYILGAVVMVLVLLYLLGVIGGGEVAVPSTTG